MQRKSPFGHRATTLCMIQIASLFLKFFYAVGYPIKDRGDDLPVEEKIVHLNFARF